MNKNTGNGMSDYCPIEEGGKDLNIGSIIGKRIAAQINQALIELEELEERMKTRPLHIQYIRLKDDIERDTNSYPFNIPLIRNFKKIEFKKPVTFICRENGTGKSTLLEAFAISYGFNTEGGSKNFNFKTRDIHSSFHECLRIGKTVNHAKDGFFLRPESFYNLATNIDELDKDPGGPRIIESYGGISLHEQSHAENFWSLLKNRLGGNGVYIFDEPETAFSPMRLLELLVIIDELVKSNSQFIISTHSPILMAYPNADIYEIVNDRLQLTEFEDTRHFSVTKYFLMNYKKMIENLGIS
jgi:predicted ATPase